MTLDSLRRLVDTLRRIEAIVSDWKAGQISDYTAHGFLLKHLEGMSAALAALDVDAIEKLVDAARRIDASATITDGTGWTEVRLDDYPNPVGNMFVQLRAALSALSALGDKDGEGKA